MTEMWIVVGLCAVLGVPFTLWWWKIADRWADAEHKRFKPKPKPKGNAVVVRGFGAKDAAADGRADGAARADEGR